MSSSSPEESRASLEEWRRLASRSDGSRTRLGEAASWSSRSAGDPKYCTQARRRRGRCSCHAIMLWLAGGICLHMRALAIGRWPCGRNSIDSKDSDEIASEPECTPSWSSIISCAIWGMSSSLSETTIGLLLVSPASGLRSWSTPRPPWWSTEYADMSLSELEAKGCSAGPSMLSTWSRLGETALSELRSDDACPCCSTRGGVGSGSKISGDAASAPTGSSSDDGPTQ